MSDLASNKNQECMVDHTKFRLALLQVIFFFGLLFIFITPPIQTADEDSHLIRSVMVAEGNIFSKKEGERWGQHVPFSLIAYVEKHRYLASSSETRYHYDQWYVDSYSKDQKSDRVLHSYSGQSLSPFYYIPQALAINTAKFIYIFIPAEFNWPAAMYASRIGNLVFYILVWWQILRVLPQFSSIFAFLALNPMSLSLAASSSYDVPVIMIGVAFLAYTLHLHFNKIRLTTRSYLSVFALSFALGHCKVIYSPVLLCLFLFLPSMGWKTFIKFTGAAGLSAIAGIIVSSAVFGLPEQPHLQSAIDSQTEYVFKNLLSMPSLVLHSIHTQSLGLFISSLGNLGWLNANVPGPLLTLWFCVGVASVLVDSQNITFGTQRLKEASFIVGGAVISLFVLFLAMYITWTSLTTGIGAPVIDSVQGRYLLPLFPYFMIALTMLLAFFKIPGLSNRATHTSFSKTQITISSATLCVMLFMLVARYWIPTQSV